LTDISILYDQSETDELGIKLTAEQMGIDLGYLPFYKVAYAFDHQTHSLRTTGKDYTQTLDDTSVVLNRCESKARRIFATTILEANGKDVLNPQTTELFCQSKLRTLLAFASADIKVPRTVYASPNVAESTGSGRVHDNSDALSQLFEQELGLDGFVVKPDAGSHGRGVSHAASREELMPLLAEITPGITNPSGVMAQELIPKWFYDLRIIVHKEKGGPPVCHENALARGGFKEFRTNTFLGNMVFRARLPAEVRRTAERCAEILGGGADGWVIGLDAMPRIPVEWTGCEAELRENFVALEEPFSGVTRVKRMTDKKRRFREYTDAVTEAYLGYMDSEPYRYIESVVNETLQRAACDVYFHEGNACPEFWEQTRVVGGINLAADLLGSALRLLG